LPGSNGGATGVGRQLLMELARQGVEVDCYFPGKLSSIPGDMAAEKRLRFICEPSSWEWNRWYSRNNYMAFLTGQLANLRSEMKLAERLVESHRSNPYDLVYQFSHIEMHALKRFKRQLPLIVLHPSVHAAGELRWHRKEKHLSRVSESLLTRLLVRGMLTARAIVQKNHIRHADYVLSLSRNFATEMMTDYRLDPGKVMHLVPNPIDVENLLPRPEIYPGPQKFRTDGRCTFLFVSRISVRKGTEMMVELSHRLADLSSEVRIIIVGNHSLWSDYRGLLAGLHKDVASYIGEVSGPDMHALYNSVDALIQPSHYEPFGLTVGEALSCGLPVIASDKVGAAEEADRSICRIFKAGDMDGLEAEVRQLAGELLASKQKQLAEKARSEAIRLFSAEVIVTKLVEILHSLTYSPLNRNQHRKAVPGRTAAEGRGQ
jgi:glycosyltransferase involved in cell wall biosynthesis